MRTTGVNSNRAAAKVVSDPISADPICPFSKQVEGRGGGRRSGSPRTPGSARSCRDSFIWMFTFYFRNCMFNNYLVYKGLPPVKAQQPVLTDIHSPSHPFHQTAQMHLVENNCRRVPTPLRSTSPFADPLKDPTPPGWPPRRDTAGRASGVRLRGQLLGGTTWLTTLV